MKTKTPITSRLSIRQIRKEGTDKALIIQIRKGLQRIKKGNRTMIAQACNLPEVRIWRRLSEMERAGEIEKTGEVIYSSTTGMRQAEWRIKEKK